MSGPLSSPSPSGYCHEDILQLAAESEEAKAEGGQRGQIIVIIAAALALATSGVTIATTTVATVAAVAVTAAAGIGVPGVRKAADHLVTLGLSWSSLVDLAIVVIVEVMVVLWLLLVFV